MDVQQFIAPATCQPGIGHAAHCRAGRPRPRSDLGQNDLAAWS